MGQADVLRWLEEHPGWHGVQAIADALGLHRKTAGANLTRLNKSHEVEARAGVYGRYEYRYLSPDRKEFARVRGRAGKSVENRVGQAWKSGSVQVIGEDIFGQAKLFVLPAGHFQCKFCLHVQKTVRVDERGFAACESCGSIYNDGKPDEQKMSNRERKRRMEKHKYECCHKGQ
jgi:DNA-binding MarR family transcriptional regulator